MVTPTLNLTPTLTLFDAPHVLHIIPLTLTLTLHTPHFIFTCSHRISLRYPISFYTHCILSSSVSGPHGLSDFCRGDYYHHHHHQWGNQNFTTRSSPGLDPNPSKLTPQLENLTSKSSLTSSPFQAIVRAFLVMYFFHPVKKIAPNVAVVFSKLGP